MLCYIYSSTRKRADTHGPKARKHFVRQLWVRHRLQCEKEARRTSGAQHDNKSDRLRLGHIRLGASFDDCVDETLQSARSHTRVGLVAAVRRVERRLHPVRALLGLHSLSDARQHGALGHDGTHTGSHTVSDGEEDAQDEVLLPGPIGLGREEFGGPLCPRELQASAGESLNNFISMHITRSNYMRFKVKSRTKKSWFRKEIQLGSSNWNYWFNFGSLMNLSLWSTIFGKIILLIEKSSYN